MRLILVLLASLTMSTSWAAACSSGIALLSRLIMPMLGVLIQTVVVLVPLLLVGRLASFLGRRVVLSASEVTGSRRWIAFVLVVHV